MNDFSRSVFLKYADGRYVQGVNGIPRYKISYLVGYLKVHQMHAARQSLSPVLG